MYTYLFNCEQIPIWSNANVHQFQANANKASLVKHQQILIAVASLLILAWYIQHNLLKSCFVYSEIFCQLLNPSVFYGIFCQSLDPSVYSGIFCQFNPFVVFVAINPMPIDECDYCAPVVLIVLDRKGSVRSTEYNAQLLEVHMANATFYLILLIPTSMLPIKYAVSWGPLGCVWSFGGWQNFYFPLITWNPSPSHCPA